jgi:hypothetical protein
MVNLSDWTAKQYAEIGPGIKSSLIWVVLAAMVTGFHWLMSGLPLWRHVLADAVLLIVAIWAGIATINWLGKRAVSVIPNIALPSDPYADVLTPLQIDALRLAHDLLAFQIELGPQPNEMTVVEWRRIVRAKYALRFHTKAVNVCQRLAEISLSDHHFASLVDSTDSQENVVDLAHTLRRMAFSAFGD